ncbi:MAG: dual OB domain-containing protein [Gammaproteobacteria bacterium]
MVERKYLNQADGQYDILHPVLCISLGDPYQGYFYKLIAAVLYSERFTRDPQGTESDIFTKKRK